MDHLTPRSVSGDGQHNGVESDDKPWTAIGGVSAAYALRRRSTGQFLRQRVGRLLLPLAFGVLVLAPPQVYLERLSHSQFAGTFLQFYPRYFSGIYGFGGNFAFFGLHLWNPLALFVFSLLLVPVAALLHSSPGRALTARAVDLFSWPVSLFALAAPLMAMELALPRDGIGVRYLGGWNLFQYLVLFVYGYALLAEERVRAAVAEAGLYALMLALLGTPAAVWVMMPGNAPQAGSGDLAVGLCLVTFVSWCWVLSLLYAGRLYLNRSGTFLRWASEAVMPFYMLHQTVILVVGYYVLQTASTPAAKYAAI
ncbi:MAG: acyltransferase family protein, partial [Anaerolineae bacterium]